MLEIEACKVTLWFSINLLLEQSITKKSLILYLPYKQLTPLIPFNKSVYYVVSFEATVASSLSSACLKRLQALGKDSIGSKHRTQNLTAVDEETVAACLPY